MQNGDRVKEFVKYIFTDDEKKEISISMARDVSQKNALEDDKKAAMSDFKAQIDNLDGMINRSAQQLNSGYQHQNMEVEVRFNPDGNIVDFLNIETRKILKSRPMKSDESQMAIDF